MLQASPAWTTNEIPDLSGRTAIVTGASSGLGRVVAEQLAHHGATVVLAVRNLTKGEVVRRELLAVNPSLDLEVAELDLIDLESVRRFAEPWRAGDRTLDLLVNNAGIGASRHLLSPQGIESSWATNVVGHFALTALLFDRLTADARIVHVGSNLYKRIAVELPLEEIAAARRFSATKSYVASKLANILFGDELDRRLRAAGSSMRSLTAHPGVANTPMQTDREKLSERLIGTVIGAAFGRPPEAAAVALLYAATAPNAPTGLFLGPSLRRRDARVHAEPPKPPADDRALAARLWTRLEAQSGTTIQLDRVAQRAQTANAEGGLSPRSSSGRAA